MSSNVFPSGGKPAFNPNTSFEIVDEPPMPKSKKPAFNPKASFEPISETQEQVTKSKGQENVITFKPMTDWLSIPKEYEPMVAANVVDEHTKKVSEASGRIQSHLSDIDNSIKNLIYDYKKDISGRIKSQQLALQPGFEAAPINQQAQQLESRLRQDIPVGEDEINDFKTEMGNNPVMLRQGLAQKAKDLSNKDISAANQLKADVYRVDAQQRKDKENKIDKNIEKLNEGEYDYDIVRGALVKPEGFFSSLVTGYKQKVDAFSDYDVYKSGDEKKILETINKRLKDDPDEAKPIPDGLGGEAGVMLGGQPLKPLIGGGIAGYFSGGTAAAAATAAISAPEMYKLTFGSVLPHNYDAIKKANPDLTDSEALQQAIDLTHDQANTDALSGAAMGALGAKAGFKPTGLNSALLEKSLSRALTQIGETAAKKSLEGLGVGSVGAAGQLVKNLMAKKAGLDIDESEGLAQQLIGGVGMTMGMTMIAKFPQLLKPKTYNQLLQSFKGVPKEVVQENLSQLQESGTITPEEAQKAQINIQEHQAIDNSIKPNVPEAERLKVQELIKKRNELEASLEVEDKAYHADTKEKIKSLNDKINSVSKGEDRGELQVLVDKENKDGNIEGFVTDTLVNASENDLKKYFKEIAQQVNDGNEELAIKTFGENIVNKAKELFPVEAPKESKISVIQPGEIKQPETITIKPREQEAVIISDGINKPVLSSNELIGGDVLNADLPDDYISKSGKGIKVGRQTRYDDIYDAAYDMGIISNTTKRLFEYLKGKVKATLTNKDGGPVEGMYTPSDSHIRVYKKNANWVIIHEAIHAAIDKLGKRKDKAFIGELRSIADEVKEKYNTNKKEFIDNYGNDFDWSIYQIIRNGNEEEVITYFLTNEKFRKFANEIGVSEKIHKVIPKEIRPQIQPETITIKPKEDAISERSAETPIVDETSGSSPEMGQRVPESGETAIPQEAIGQPQEEGAPSSQEKVSGIHVERPPTQLSFRGLQETANEFGFEDVRSRDRVSDIQERKNAEIETEKWVAEGTYQENINDLLTRIENRTLVPVARQRLILEQYLANEKQKARELPKNSEEYNKQLKKVERIKDIGTIARQEAGAALRLPDGGSLPHPILDEADAMIAKKRANAVDDLTDQQKAEVEAQVSKYKQAADEANAKVAKLEEQVANIDAEKEFKKAKSTTKRTKKTAEERIAYRKEQIEAAREALKKLRTGESGLSAVPLPGVRELMAIAPYVKNIMVDLVEQGVTELADAVKQLHEQFKDVLEGLTEKDVHNIIAGEYNKPQKTKSQLQRQLEDLNYEAKLINQLESLERGIEPKSEKAKRERNQKIKALRDKIKDLRKQKAAEDKEAESFYKEEIDDEAKKLIAIKKRNEKRAQEIKDKIAKGDFAKEEKKSIFDREDIKKTHPNLRKDALDAIAQKEEAQHEFDLALFKDEMAKRPWYQKGASFAAKLIHTSKAVMSGIDDSATFVQTGLAMLANPKIGAKVWLKHWREAFSDAEFKRELAAIHSDPDYPIMQKSELEIVEPATAIAKAVDEAFEQNLLAGKIKIKDEFGKVINEYQPWKYTGGIFERAFISMGNNFRVKLFKERIQMLKDEGKTFESHSKEYKDAARVINELTSRGRIPKGLAQATPYITPFVWAPRMLTSTINALGLSDLALGLWHKGYYQNLTPAQRKFALAQLGRGISLGVGIMGAAALGGATVDYDPRSVTFGDVIIGDHHYNVFGRFVPVVKTLVQFSFGERIKKGKIQDLDNPKYGGKTRLGVVGGFLRGKATPAFGAAMNLAEGRNYFTQEEFGVKDLPKALLMPMSIDDLIDGWNHDGTTAILTRFLPAFEGLKVSDERDFEKKEKESSSSKIIKKGINRTKSREIKYR